MPKSWEPVNMKIWLMILACGSFSIVVRGVPPLVWQ